MQPRDLAELVRAPAALSVPGDVLAGAAAAGFPYGRRTPLAAGASVCLYWAGMALNDYADRELDAQERPERPLPSGRITPRQALSTAGLLTAGGLALAGAAGGRRALALAAPLAATVWAYDLLLKPTAAGPVAMAAARGLDVALGAGARREDLRRAAPAACCLAAHTLAVTALSRDEVHGSTPRRLIGPLATTAGVAGAAALAGPRSGRAASSPAARLTAAAFAGAYAATAGRAQWRAAQRPTARRVREAVGAGIMAMVPLQAGLAAGAGAPRSAAALAAVHPLARRLARRFAVT